MLEKLLKELGERGYKVSWLYEAPIDSVIIRLVKTYPGKERGRYQFCKQLTFDEMRDIAGGRSGFEFAMTQYLRWMAEKMEEDMEKHYGYRPRVVICDELAGEKGESND